jgi:hypothetical protein
MEPQFRTRSRSVNLLEHKKQVKVGLGNENRTMTRATVVRLGMMVLQRVGRSDPSINGHLHYPNDVDRLLNETETDKIRKYHGDCRN